MSTIPASAIVNVTPNVLAAGGSSLDVIGLILSLSDRVPIGTVQSFASPAAVSDFFGADSQEKAVADVYFGGFENSNAKPGSVLFAQYPEEAVSAYVRGGDVSALTLAELQALSGSLHVVVDGYARNAASVDLSASTSFSSAAGIIETALNAATGNAAAFTAAISGVTMTVSAVVSGTLAVGQTVVGGGVTAGTRITALGSGAGGTGTYTVSASQTVGSESMTSKGTDVVATYDSTSGGFVVTSGITGAISTVAFPTGTIAASVKLTAATGATLSQGAAAATPSAFMDAVVVQTQNWVTFMTVFDPDVSGFANKLAFAAWTDAQNDRYAYLCWDTDVNPTLTDDDSGCLGAAIVAAGYSGTSVWYDPSGPTLPQFVAGVAASIDFEQTNGRITFAFKRQAGLAATATTQQAMDNLIANGYNFYGAYGTGNDEFVWAYPGSVSGDFEWLDSYVNQVWLNNAFQLAFMTLLQNSLSIPYNAAGRALIEAAAADPINAGLNFGAFRAGVALSAAQIAAVNAAAVARISDTLQQRGWYLKVGEATAEVRAARGSPPCTFWYVDGQSVQKINLTSVALV